MDRSGKNVETPPGIAMGVENGRGAAAPGVVAATIMLLAEDLDRTSRDQGRADGVGAHARFGPVGAGTEIKLVGLK